MDSGSTALFLVLGEDSLLRVALYLFCGDRDQISKETLRPLLGTSGEVDFRCRRLIRVKAL